MKDPAKRKKLLAQLAAAEAAWRLGARPKVFDIGGVLRLRLSGVDVADVKTLHATRSWNPSMVRLGGARILFERFLKFPRRGRWLRRRIANVVWEWQSAPGPMG